MKLLNLRYQEYKLALLYLRASALIANNVQLNKTDRNYLIIRLYEYCYYRYLTFDLSKPIGVRNHASVKSRQAKEYIISYFERNTPSTTVRYCNKIFGVHNWSHVIISDYYD